MNIASRGAGLAGVQSLERIQLRPHGLRGRLIVIEGTDGAGKSTLIHGTAEALRWLGADVLTTVQPTPGIRATEVFRAFSETSGPDTALYRALYLVTVGDRLYHAASVIEPHMRSGGIVLSDRYVFTTMANIMARGQGFEPWFVETVAHLPRPDLAILLHCPVGEAVRRIRLRPDERDRPIDIPHLTRVREAFLKLAELGHLRAIDSSAITTEQTRALVYGWLQPLVAQR